MWTIMHLIDCLICVPPLCRWFHLILYLREVDNTHYLKDKKAVQIALPEIVHSLYSETRVRMQGLSGL